MAICHCCNMDESDLATCEGCGFESCRDCFGVEDSGKTRCGDCLIFGDLNDQPLFYATQPSGEQPR